MLNEKQLAVSSIKEGLREVSSMHPFLEFKLPFYDSMQDIDGYLVAQEA